MREREKPESFGIEVNQDVDVRIRRVGCPSDGSENISIARTMPFHGRGDSVAMENEFRHALRPHIMLTARFACGENEIGARSGK